ncbi:MAG: hypothetical protein HZA02_01350 [Nitrospinae bacterium]|nr:hypothetical protein [Nitrospinota bacterium]
MSRGAFHRIPNLRVFRGFLLFFFLFVFVCENALALNATEKNVISPYWQADTSVYTYIGISHPSVSGMASRIGMVVTALTTGGSAPTFTNEGNSSVSNLTFTISAGTVEKIFIVLTNQALMPSPTSVPTAKFFSITSTSGHSGTLYIQPAAANPDAVSNSLGTPGGAGKGDGDGIRSVEMLSIWGAIVVQATSTGFAMEFVGDNHSVLFVNGFVDDEVANISGAVTKARAVK